MQRLNWGAAFDLREGWVNSDLIDYGQEHVGDILDGLPFPDNHFDMIVANHAVQMIRFHDLEQALGELRRVLKPGGVLRVLVPDFNLQLERWLAGDLEQIKVSSDIEHTDDGRFLRYIFWHGDTRSAFTKHSLRDVLKRSGYDSVYRVDYGTTMSDYPEIVELDSRKDESLIMEAVK